MPDIKVRVGQQNAVKVVASAFGGSLTAENAVNATNVLGGIASVTQLDVSPGISTFAGAVGINSTLYVAGITTLADGGGITTTGGDLYVGGDLFVLDDITLDEVNLRNLNVTGVSTLGITSATWLEAQQLNVTGVSTFVGLSTFSGDVVFQGAAAAQNMTWDASENDLEFTDLARIKFGNSDDLEIWHGSGNNSHIKNSTNDLKIRSDSLILKRADDTEAYLKATVNSDVKIYYNGNEKFATTGVGVTVLGTTETQQLNVSGVTTFSGSNVYFPGAAYNIQWDKATSKFKFDDSAQLVFGSASGGDMKLFHQSGNSTIRNETGQFRIAGNDIRLQTQNHSEDYLLAVDGGSVSIFHNDVKRLETTASGVDITDTLNVAGVSTFVGIVTTSSDLYIGGDLYISDDLVLDNITGNSLKITGLSTFVGNAQFDGNVSIGGTLTYEDVTNIDSVGLITARSGVRVTAGGLVVTAGVSTFVQDVSLTTGDLTIDTGDVTVSTGDLIITSGDLNAGADILVADNIRHKGDTDTYIEFTNDKIRLIAGGKSLIHAEEASIDTVIINDGSNDLDFRVEGQNDEYQIFSDGSTDRVGIGSAIPTVKLDVTGSTNISGTLTAGLIDGGSF